MNTSMNRGAALAGAAILALGLAACDGSSNTRDTTGTETTTPATQTTTPATETTTPATGGSDAPGLDPTLDAMWETCATGDMAACDELYYTATTTGADDAYVLFGGNCGGTQPDGYQYWCDAASADIYGVPGSESSGTAGTGTATGGIPNGTPAPGTDAALDALWNACGSGDMGACDELYFSAELGSDYETYGGTCGGLFEPGHTALCEG